MRIKKLNLDIIRLILTLMVVAVHTYPLLIFNETLDYAFTRVLFRLAVPIFLMISGYFILPKALKNKNVLKDYTLKILKLYGLSILIYLPINCYMAYFKNNTILQILKDVFINGTFYHLWYFPALILGLWLVYFLVRHLDSKKIKLLLFLLFIIGLFGDSYYGLIVNIKPIFSFYEVLFKIADYTRNGLFYTPIFIYMGYLFSTRENSLSASKNLILISLSLGALLLEGLVLLHYNVPRHTSMYLSLLPLTYYLFNLIIYNRGASSKKIRLLAKYLYILHPTFIIVFRFTVKVLNLESLIENNLIAYLFVSFTTTIFILIIIKIKEVFAHVKQLNYE